MPEDKNLAPSEDNAEILPHHALSHRWKDAYLDIYGVQPSKTWDVISSTDKSRIMGILKKWQTKEEQELAAERQQGFACDSDTPDIFISDHLYKSGLLDNIAIDSEMETLFVYNGKNWELMEYKAFENFINHICLKKIMSGGYNNGKVKAIADMVHKNLKALPNARSGFISFSNTVVEITEHGNVKTHDHSQNFGLMSTASYEYDPKAMSCPNFEKWLSHATSHEDPERQEEKRQTMLAVLYFVATNQYRWQYFIEIIGAGGSGKSIALTICSILVGGEANTCVIDINALEGKQGKGAYQNLIGKPLILSPDQGTTVSELPFTKRIVGNDPISIPRMHKADINLPFLPAVMVITANQPITSTDRSSGVFRRRVTVFMNSVIDETIKDLHLAAKLKQEAAAILNYVLKSFETPIDAYHVLKKAITNADKMEAMLITEPLTNWISECLKPTRDFKEAIGSQLGVNQARKGGQVNTAKQLLVEAETALYPNYLIWCEANGINKPLSVVKFPDALEDKIKQLGTLGFIPLNKITPKNKRHFVNIEINRNSSFLCDLRETADNYCKFEDMR